MRFVSVQAGQVAQLPDALFLEREKGRVRNDHVVEELDSQQIAGVPQLIGRTEILRTWGGLARGVIVAKDQRNCSAHNRWLKHFARMNEGAIGRSD